MSRAVKPADVLLAITERRRRRLGAQPPPKLDQQRLQDASCNAFCAGLVAHRGNAVIAEIKMGSPKLGSLVGTFDPVEQARIYGRGGAAALSVVVEPDSFFGSYELLTRCKQASGLPAIAKDFLVHPDQVEMARAAGADAVLLIAALLTRQELIDYARYARSLGLVPLVETHSPDEVADLVDEDWELVGINNRDLRTFEVDLERSIALVESLPAGALRVAESGIGSSSDIERLAEAGFDAFLIGETLVTSDSPAETLRGLLGGDHP